jgi:hypothetical protein
MSKRSTLVFVINGENQSRPGWSSRTAEGHDRGLWRAISFGVACSGSRRRRGVLAKEEEDAPLGSESEDDASHGTRDNGSVRSNLSSSSAMSER